MRTVQESYSLAWTLNLVTPPRWSGSFFAAPGLRGINIPLLLGVRLPYCSAFRYHGADI